MINDLIRCRFAVRPSERDRCEMSKTYVLKV